MGDYNDVTLPSRYTFTLREDTWAKPDERGQWRRANCKCGARLDIVADTSARDLLHWLWEHSCAKQA